MNRPKKETIFDFLTQVCITYTLSVISIITMARFVGEEAKGISKLFAFGNNAIAIDIMLEWLLMAVLITGIEWLLSSDVFKKRFSDVTRQILMLTFVGIVSSGGIWLFGWFPINMWQTWVGFIICYVVCTVFSMIFMIMKVRVENKIYKEELELYLKESGHKDREDLK